MNQDRLHTLAGFFSISGGLCIATGILTFNPELLYGGTLITVGGAIITLCLLERQRDHGW